MNEPKYQYSTTNTSVKYNERGIKGSLTFGVGGPIAAAKVGELFEEVNELERQLAALVAERDALIIHLETARLAMEEYQKYRRMNTLNFQLEKADSYLAPVIAALQSEQKP